MKHLMQRVRYALLCTTLLMLLGTSAVADTQQQPPPGLRREALDAVVGGFVSAWNSHDMRRFAMLFEDNAEFVNVFGTWWHGRANIGAAHDAIHRSVFRATTLEPLQAVARQLGPDLVMVHWRWRLTGVLGPVGQSVPERFGVLTHVALRDATGWKIVTTQNTPTLDEPYQAHDSAIPLREVLTMQRLARAFLQEHPTELTHQDIDISPAGETRWLACQMGDTFFLKVVTHDVLDAGTLYRIGAWPAGADKETLQALAQQVLQPSTGEKPTPARHRIMDITPYPTPGGQWEAHWTDDTFYLTVRDDDGTEHRYKVAASL